jgi:glutamine amidotransferase
MSTTAIIDYGVGNLFSLASSLRYLGLDSIVTADAADIRNADRIILPGVGAFGDAIQKLHATGLVPVLDAQVAAGKPLLGICLGMQLLFQRSFEYGEHRGLGYLPGSVCPFAADFEAAEISLKVPHMGWNSLDIRQPEHPLMKYTPDGSYVYFVHSFYAKDCSEAIVASSEYGVTVPAAVASGNVCGCQFHPEKSGPVGLEIIRAFSEM